MIVTLWVVTILSVLAIAIARYLSLEIRLTKYRLAHEQARALARSGVYLARQRLARDSTPGYDWLGDGWTSFPVSGSEGDATHWIIPVTSEPSGAAATGGKVEIRITDEERKLNVNAADEGQLRRLLDSDELAQAILEYEGRPPTETHVEEPPYYPKNGRVAGIEELLDLPQLAEDAGAMQKLRGFTFAVPEAESALRVNVNTAEPDVLYALGAIRDVVDQLVASRSGPDGVLGTEDDCKATDTVHAAEQLGSCAMGGNPLPVAEIMLLPGVTVTVDSSIFHITVDAILISNVTYHIEAVVRRTGCVEGPSPCIIAWRES